MFVFLIQFYLFRICRSIIFGLNISGLAIRVNFKSFIASLFQEQLFALPFFSIRNQLYSVSLSFALIRNIVFFTTFQTFCFVMFRNKNKNKHYSMIRCFLIAFCFFQNYNCGLNCSKNRKSFSK